MTWKDFFLIEEKYRGWGSHGRSKYGHTYFRIRELKTMKKVNGRTYNSRQAAENAAQSMFLNITHQVEKDMGLR